MKDELNYTHVYANMILIVFNSSEFIQFNLTVCSLLVVKLLR